jgi:hypothetical protein
MAYDNKKNSGGEGTMRKNGSGGGAKSLAGQTYPSGSDFDPNAGPLNGAKLTQAPDGNGRPSRSEKANEKIRQGLKDTNKG